MKNPDKARQQLLEWRTKNPDKAAEHKRKSRRKRIAKAREYARAYRSANREKVREYDRSHRLLNAERVRKLAREAARERYAKRPETKRLRSHNRRALMHDASASPLTRSQWELVCDSHRDHGGRVICAYCKEPCKPTIDHVVPLSRGGLHVQQNVAPACKSCNSSKGDRLLSEWNGTLFRERPAA